MTGRIWGSAFGLDRFRAEISCNYDFKIGTGLLGWGWGLQNLTPTLQEKLTQFQEEIRDLHFYFIIILHDKTQFAPFILCISICVLGQGERVAICILIQKAYWCHVITKIRVAKADWKHQDNGILNRWKLTWSIDYLRAFANLLCCFFLSTLHFSKIAHDVFNPSSYLVRSWIFSLHRMKVLISSL